MKELDKIDRRILQHLQRNGRIPNNELADAVHLSPSTCLRRVRALEDAGIIKGYVALLDPSKIGKGFTAYVRVWLTSQDFETIEKFVAEIQPLSEVVECHLMAGECDVMLRVVAADLTAYRQFQINHLTRIESVRSIKTEVPMEQAKLTTELPI